jgi:hypothetical protein
MSNHRSRKIAVGAALAIAASAAACRTDSITDLNKNPNSPEDVPASTLFTNGVRVAVNSWMGQLYDLRAAEFLIQHMAEAQYPDEDRYARLGAGNTSNVFASPYPNELEDFQKVVGKGQAAKSPGTWAPAQIMQTWEFDYLTNTFGDIPYFQALKGDSLGGSISPAYDTQKDIYTDMFAKLTAASTALTGATPDLGRADPIYGGDVVKWQRFSNSLRARLAITLINVDPATANTQLTAALKAPGGVITTNSQNAQLVWPGDGVYDNPFASFFQTRDDNRMSQTLINIMNTSSDPRVGIYAQPLPGTTNTYAGMPNGLTAAAAGQFLNKASRIGAVLFPGATAYGFYGGSGKSFPSFMMTAAEMNFIQAEAAERGIGGLTPGQAKGFYEAGVRASMDQWGVTDGAAVTAFLAKTGNAYAAGTAGLKQIAIQKYVALYTDGGTAWTEWRRTCEPETIKPGPAATSSTVPRRLMYSPTEVSVNADALKAAIARQGPDAFQTRVYFDTKASAAPTYTSTCGAQ